ncbi:AraC family transcriptional regulator ligand-binding domain-containing protein [Spongiibacter marinus]|uniref:AraC family transcriptional regulator ligand-binding domain-containing protein n=1 Tax=Spongiibacter marinus TaxID=354246 RepID=UPI0019619140|nr:AraC-like DNA-binding protein [Spongiibacter marinus]
MQHFVRSGALLGFSEWVRDCGQNPNALMAEFGLTPAVVHDPDLYLSYTVLAQLMTAAAERCGREDFGVQLGVRQGLEAVGALGSAMCLQATIADALRMMQRNLDFHAKGVVVSAISSERFIEIRMDFAFASVVDCGQLAGLSLALLARCLEQLQSSPVRPDSLALRAQAPAAAELSALFGCRVEPDEGCDALRYPLSLMSSAVDVEPGLRSRLSAQWRGASEPASLSLRQQLDQTITALLPTGECSLSMVARVMGLHPRSLQQRLQCEGSSFAQVLSARRQYLACEHLAHSDIDLTTLALSLGYSELAVFSRAFKVWTGVSPSQWRKQLA